jgi:hypothetical protein
VRTLYQRRGLVRATTARSEDGWAVIVQWAGEDVADPAALDELLALADPGTVERRRFTTLD